MSRAELGWPCASWHGEEHVGANGVGMTEPAAPIHQRTQALSTATEAMEASTFVPQACCRLAAVLHSTGNVRRARGRRLAGLEGPYVMSEVRRARTAARVDRGRAYRRLTRYDAVLSDASRGAYELRLYMLGVSSLSLSSQVWVNCGMWMEMK